MLYSKSFIFTAREDPKQAECASHRLMLKGSFIYMVSSGIYAYLPLGYRVLSKVSDIVRKYMNACGAEELALSALQPIEMWKKTGRDKDLEQVMFKFKDRKDRELCLGPTHEEEITEIMRKFIFSYKQLPVIAYQIHTKFRDEPRPRFGLLRSCEFIMKDAYSFDIDEEGLSASYKKMLSAYQDIFKDCGLNFVLIEAESGFMGGEVSHEFMVPAEIGEDILFYCKPCGKYYREKNSCSQCGGELIEKRMIEVGHIFKLGTKYSLAQEAFFLDKSGTKKPIIMGCYGIGVSRLLSAIVEQNHDEKGIIWPRLVSPYDVVIAVLDENLLSEALAIEALLTEKGLSLLVDDRHEAAGVKFNDALLLGNPYTVVIGKNYAKTKKFDIESRRTKEKLSLSKDELIEFFKTQMSADKNA